MTAPHSVEAEEAILGSILIDPQAFEAVQFLQAGDFFIVRNLWIWESFVELHNRNAPIDFLTVTEALDHRGRLAEAGGPAYLTGLMNAVPTAINAVAYAEIVRAASLRRAGMQIVTQAYREIAESNGNLPEVLSLSSSRIDALTTGRSTSVRLAEAGGDWLVAMRQYVETGKYAGLTTGYGVLDRHTHGLGRRKVAVLAGRPSMGKSALALQMAYRQARAGLRVGIFSMEMPRADVAGRVALAECDVDKYHVNRLDLQRIEAVVADFNRLSIAVCDDTLLTAGEISREAREMRRSLGGLDVLVVDHLGYVQHAGERGDNETVRIGRTMKALARLAKDMDVALLVLCQLSREVLNRHDKAPDLQDLRDSGHIEQDARMVLMLHRPGYYADLGSQPPKDEPQAALVLVRKNDDGPRGDAIRLAFVEQSARFAEWTNANE